MSYNDARDEPFRAPMHPSLHEKLQMKTIVCFGDSNTWGYSPGDGKRHPWELRWTGILQKQLGDRVRVLEEGQCGRTTCFDDPFSPNRNGLKHLPIVLETHSPIDLLVIMLGTNDLKVHFNLTAFSIARGASTLLVAAKSSQASIEHILLVSPAHIVKTEDFHNIYQFERGIERSKELAEHYHRFAALNQCHFFDAASVAQSSSIDGIHLDVENHQRLAQGLHKKIEAIFADGRS